MSKDVKRDQAYGSNVKLHRWEFRDILWSAMKPATLSDSLSMECIRLWLLLRITWKQKKLIKNKIQYTFKLEVFGKLFHFDHEGLKSESLSDSSLRSEERLKPKFLYMGTEIIDSGFDFKKFLTGLTEWSLIFDKNECRSSDPWIKYKAVVLWKKTNFVISCRPLQITWDH